jgi:predicted MPP superfamily phosphohydrolase
MKINKFLYWGLVLIALGFSGLGLYGIFIEPYQVEIHHVRIENARLAKVLEGKIVVHLSDLHISKLGKREQKVLKILEEIEPDFVFLTGDYIQWNGDNDAALTFLSKLKAKVGVWAVMGDYDYTRSRTSCLFCHEAGSGQPTRRHNVRFLKNSLEHVSLPDGSIAIGGIDREADLPFSSDTPSFPEKLEEPVIILSHDPLNFELIDDDQDVLMLSGDTHGGQMPLPSRLWGLLGYEKCARYSHGLFERGKKKMFVSRGIGTSHVPIRIFRRPEVVVLHFLP